jgi:hypothetical protein
MAGVVQFEYDSGRARMLSSVVDDLAVYKKHAEQIGDGLFCKETVLLAEMMA